MKKLYILLLIIFIFNLGCINKEKNELTDRELMAKNFRKLVGEIQDSKTIKRVTVDYLTVLDGVYVEKVDKMEYYSSEKLAILTTEDLNKLIADLYEGTVVGKKALIVFSNRALEYARMVKYLGPSDFSDDEKSCLATEKIALDDLVYDISKSRIYYASGKQTGGVFESFVLDTTIETVGRIDNENYVIELTVAKIYEADLATLKAKFTLSDGAVVKVGELLQESEVTVNDFTNTIVYKVEAVDGVINSYNVNVKVNNLGNDHPLSGVYSTIDEANWGVADYKLGANGTESERTFAVYSKNANKVLLEIYESSNSEDAKYDYWMQKGSDNIWRAKLKDIPNGTFYAFRVWGDNWTYNEAWTRGNTSVGFVKDVDLNGNRFNPNKVLYDPYTKEMSHDKETPEMISAGEEAGMYGTGGAETVGKEMIYKGIDSRNYDTGRWAPKSVVIDDSTDYGTKPQLEQKDAIIYETHVRGMTNHESSMRLTTILNGIDGFEDVIDIADGERGTYVGAGKLAKYLKALGITTVELLPVHETANDMNSDTSPAGNFWGYMTFGYFAPDRRYSSDKTPGGPTREFKEMVKAFHDEGMEVYLDVVYNHTGEGGNWGHNDVTGFVSFGGFDAAEYYQLTTENGIVDGATGCGNQLNFSRDVNINLVKDSIKYWTEDMGVDGFRFDLAPVLGRKPDNFAKDAWETGLKTFYPDHELLTDLASYAESEKIELQAEAWDIWGYEVGNFTDGWAEWNGGYRDSARRFMKGDGNISDFNSKINGDYDNFNDQGGPQKSTNFLVAHDGFTLMDLVSYNAKNNGNDWPFGPSDGGSDGNDSWDSDGDQSLRRARLRNFWAIQMISRGVPLVLYGDEFARTQNGNNNPYNVDSVATWNVYDMISTDSPNTVIAAQHDNFGTDSNADGKNALFMFVKEITKFRKDHIALRQDNYSVSYEFKKENSIDDLIDGDKAVWIKINGTSVGDSDILVFVNMSGDKIDFTVPSAKENNKWVGKVDTANWAESNNNFWTANSFDVENKYSVNGWSVVILEEISLNKVYSPEMDIDSVGVYLGSKTVTLSSKTEGATIKYSLDGTDPKLGSVYSEALVLDTVGGNGVGGYQIRAIATKDGMDDSDIIEKRLVVSEQKNKTYDLGTDVMLQGFHWESHAGKDGDNWYETISNNKEDIKSRFDWVWFPPSSVAASDEGYIPVQLNKLDSLYGTEEDLKQAVTDIAPAKAIADIVINHRSGSTGWGDFTNPSFDEAGEYYSIVPNDEAFTDVGSDIFGLSESLRGWNWDDIGFDGSRDLDHSNVVVQKEIVNWMNTRLKNDIGFKGWRYDFVKGYAGEYVGYYNAKTEPEISIGELWSSPNDWDSHQTWVDQTSNGGYKSMIFDFALKSKLNSAFGWYKDTPDGSDYSENDLAMNLAELQWGYNSSKAENAVTFVDNHDTGSTQHHWELRSDRVYLAYVYILTHGGMPSVAWQHYFDWGNIYDGGITYKEHIEKLIDIRKTYGINQLSTVVIEKGDTADEYAAKIDDNIAVKIGTGMTYNPGADWGVVYSGNDFAIWKKGNIDKLKTMTLSNGTLAPEFSSEFLVYSTELSYYDDKITVNLSAEDTNAEIKVGETVLADGNLVDYSLNIGENPIVFTVTSVDGLNTKDYTLNVTRRDLSAKEIADRIKSIDAPIQDAVSLILPTVEAGYTIAIKTSSDEAIIALDGTIIPPSSNSAVNLVLTVTKTEDSSNADSIEIEVLVPVASSTPASVALEEIQAYATNSNADALTAEKLVTAGVLIGDVKDLNMLYYKELIAGKLAIADIDELKDIVSKINTDISETENIVLGGGIAAVSGTQRFRIMNLSSKTINRDENLTLKAVLYEASASKDNTDMQFGYKKSDGAYVWLDADYEANNVNDIAYTKDISSILFTEIGDYIFAVRARKNTNGYSLDKWKILSDETTPQVVSADNWNNSEAVFQVSFVDEAKASADTLSVGGVLKVGEELTVAYTYSDINNDAEGESVIRWYRASLSDGTDKTVIVGAAAKTYTLRNDDIGKYIGFDVKVVASTGTVLEGDIVMSSFTEKVKSHSDGYYLGTSDVAGTNSFNIYGLSSRNLADNPTFTLVGVIWASDATAENTVVGFGYKRADQVDITWETGEYEAILGNDIKYKKSYTFTEANGAGVYEFYIRSGRVGEEAYWKTLTDGVVELGDGETDLTKQSKAISFEFKIPPTSFVTNVPTTEDNGTDNDSKSKVTLTWIDSDPADSVDHYEIIAKVDSAPSETDTLSGFEAVAKATETASFNWIAEENLYLAVIAVGTNGLKRVVQAGNITVASDTLTLLKVETPIINSDKYRTADGEAESESSYGTSDYQPNERKISVTCVTADVTIKYSFDNWTTSNDYTEAIWIDASKTIKVKAIKDGMIESSEVNAEYKKTVLSVDRGWDAAANNHSVVFAGGNADLGSWATASTKAIPKNTSGNVWQWVSWDITENVDYKGVGKNIGTAEEYFEGGGNHSAVVGEVNHTSWVD